MQNVIKLHKNAYMLFNGINNNINDQGMQADILLPSANKAVHSGFETRRRRYQMYQFRYRYISGPIKEHAPTIFLK